MELEEKELNIGEDKLQKLKLLIADNEYTRFVDYIERLREGSYERTEIFVFEKSIDDKGKRS